MLQAAPIGDIFVTSTGDKAVVDRGHFEVMKDGAILANSGHFNVEINIPALRDMAVSSRLPRPFVEQFILADGRRISILGEGRLIQPGRRRGPPLGRHGHVLRQPGPLRRAYRAPLRRAGEKGLRRAEAIDKEIARLKLEAMGITIDTLTPEQAHYLTSWEEGT